MKKTTHLTPPLQITDGACLCGSGKAVQLCCLLPDGSLRIRPPALDPPGSITGYHKAGCYLATTGNCSNDLSGEHYISKSLLLEIGNNVSVGGLLWLPQDTQKIVGINSLTANILCSRHNKSLSPLDAHAGKFMRLLKHINNDLVTSSPNTPHEMKYLFSGEIIESWMLKVLLGLYFSKNSGGPDGPLIDKFPLDMSLVLDAILKQSWRKRCGLYMACTAGTQMNFALSFEVVVLCGLSKNMAYGARVRIYGLEFFIVIDDLDGNVLINNDNVILRPSHITFQSGVRAHTIVLTWAASKDVISEGVILSQ